MPSRLAAWAAILVVVSVAGMLSVGDAAGQELYGYHLGTWEGDVDLGYHGERDEIKIRGGQSTKGGFNRFDEQVTIRNNAAYYLDPRLLASNSSVTFGLFQEQDSTTSSGHTTDSSLNGILYGYSLDTVLLSEKPYSARIFANRTQNLVSREFGGRSELTFENMGGRFFLRQDSPLQDLGFPLFTATLGARQETSSEDTRILGQHFTRDETRTIVDLEATKGFETSDLTLNYEFSDVAESPNANAGFQSHLASLNYGLDFGNDLNKRWDSRLRYAERTGLVPTRLMSADEELRVDHSQTFYTDYRYVVSRNEVPTGPTTSQVASARAVKDFYRNVTTAVTADGTLSEFPTGEHTSYGGGASLDYRRALPWNGQLLARGTARYQIDDNQFRVSRIDVTDELHAAPATVGGNAGFALANPFVIASTIVVVDTRGGGRIPTTLGIDYVLDEQGDVTRIVPLASSPIILAGDQLAVSYAYEINPSIRYSTTSWTGSVGVDFRWIAVSFAHDQADQTLLGGTNPALLENRRTDDARLELRYERDHVRATTGAEYQIYDSTRLKYTLERYDQLVSYQPRPNLTFSLTGNETFTQFTLPKRENTTYSARGDVHWSPHPRLFIDGYAEYRLFEDSQLPTETLRAAGVRARWSYGKIEIYPDVSWNERSRGAVDTTDLRFEIRFIRRF